MTSTADTQKLIERHQRRLQKLKERQAVMGISTPPEVLIEIEDIEAELENLRGQLEAEQSQLQQTLTGLGHLSSPVTAPIEARLAEIERLLKKTATFDQRGQQVGTQVNVAGDLIQQAAPQPGPPLEALLQDYRHSLFEECRRLPLSQLDKTVSGELEAAFNLSSVYTALLTYSRADERRAVSPERDEQPQSALELLNRHKYLVLLGDPGSGKTTFVNFVTMCLAGEALGSPEANLATLTAPLPDKDGQDQKEPQSWPYGPLLPIRIILRDFAARGLPQAPDETATSRHVWDFIAAELAAAKLEKFTPHLEILLREQPCLLLLDGLDEVPEAHRRREQLKQAVEGFRKSFSKCRILVTSRGYAYQDDAWKLDRFAEGTLAPFSQGQIIRFVERWYAHVVTTRRGLTAGEAESRAVLLKQAIFSRPRLYTLAERPLLLAQMAQLHAYGQGSLPERREKLYAEMVDLLLDKWERPKLRRTPAGRLEMEQPALTQWLGVEHGRVLKFLEKLAFTVHHDQPEQTDTADIPEKELVYGLLRLSPRRGELNPDHLIDYLSQRAGLLVPRGGDEPVYTFPHRTFQEYLAARYLSDTDWPDKVAELVRTTPDRWREVTLLAGAKAAGGTASAIWLLAEALCYRQPDEPEAGLPDRWGALLAGQGLVETASLEQVSERHQKTLARVRRWLRAIVERGYLPPVDRLLAGNALAALGDDRNFDELIEIPAGPFLMGDDQDETAKPQHEITLPAYFIGKYPVTNRQFAAFIEAGGYAARNWWLPGGWQRREREDWTEPRYWHDPRFNGPNRPVVGVSWYEAMAYCAWQTEQLAGSSQLSAFSKRLAALNRQSAIGNRQSTIGVRLPTEAMWEKAARGTAGHQFPWGSDWDETRGNTSESQLGETSPVGMYPAGASPYGCLDMAGNVWEWTTSLWGPWDENNFQAKLEFGYPYDPADGREDAEAGTDVLRVVRGGSWVRSQDSARCAFRVDGNFPDLGDYDLSFRVVVAPIAPPSGL